METIPTVSVVPVPIPMFCPQCHQPIRPEDYFCANCGKNLHEPPLSTSIGTQAWIYVFSAILPIICYLAISKWPGIEYVKSGDSKTRSIGWIAVIILLISTVISFWLAAIWIQQALNGVTAGVSGGLGSLGGI